MWLPFPDSGVSDNPSDLHTLKKRLKIVTSMAINGDVSCCHFNSLGCDYSVTRNLPIIGRI